MRYEFVIWPKVDVVKCILPLIIFPNFTFLFFQYNYIIFPKLAKKFRLSQIMCQPFKLVSNLSFKKSEPKTFHLHNQTSYNGRWRIWINKNYIHSFIQIMIATPSLLTIPSLITSKPSSHSTQELKIITPRLVGALHILLSQIKLV